MARANNWTANAEKVQQLTLGLEGPAADTLKEIDETSSTAYNDIWASLKSRFGRLDEPREAMRRFENRKQADTESISDFAMQIRLLFREAWPSASADFKDSTLKRRFEDGLLSLEMSQYLRLHARDVDFATAVLKARQFADTTDMAKPKKSVKFVQLDHNHAPSDSPQQMDFKPLLDSFEKIMRKFSTRQSRSPSPSVRHLSNTHNSQRSNLSPARDSTNPPRHGTNPQSRSPSPGQRTTRDDRRSASQSPSQGRFNGSQGQRNGVSNQRSQPPGPQSQNFFDRRYQSPSNPQRTGNQNYRQSGTQYNRSQSSDARPSSRFAGPRSDYADRRQSGTNYNNQSRYSSPVRPQPSQSSRQGPATTTNGQQRRAGTCWVCGQHRCHSDFHVNDSQRRRTPPSSHSGNDDRRPSTGVRPPTQ